MHTPQALSDLQHNPAWRETSTGIFEFVPMPYLTLAADDQHGGYSLTDGAGCLYVQGTVAELSAFAHAWHAADSLAATPSVHGAEVYLRNLDLLAAEIKSPSVALEFVRLYQGLRGQGY